MSLKDEIKPYIDCEGLVSPSIPQPNTPGSNNGVMYTSEMIMMLIANKEANSSDVFYYLNKINSCMKRDGLLGRHPGGTGDQEGPDDYLAYAAALDLIQTVSNQEADEFNIVRARTMARRIVLYGLEHLGNMNNVSPKNWSWTAFLGRQPQLTAAFLWASKISIPAPLRIYVAASIIASAFNKDLGVDSWRLSWLLVQIAKRHSWICRQASKLWYRRLYKKFPNGMKDVASVYYQAGHPFSKYWVD